MAKLTDAQRNYPHVVFASSLVDIAANKDLMRESAQAFTMILKACPHWSIRTLTKSTLSHEIAEAVPEEHLQRILFGISIGILDDDVARVVEHGTPSPTKRFASLHRLQDNGLRTYAMACPSLPMATPQEYREFAEKCRDLYRYDRCEDVFAEVINGRDDNFSKTVEVLAQANFTALAWQLGRVGGKTEDVRSNWEAYARATYEAHAEVVPTEKFRFLQYVSRKTNAQYWHGQKDRGAVLLGRFGDRFSVAPPEATASPAVDGMQEIRTLLDKTRTIESKFKRKTLMLLAQWTTNVIKIGEFFSCQKDKLGHGKYLTWQITHFKIDAKTANNYVAVYRQREVVMEAVKKGTVPSLRGVYGLARRANRGAKGPSHRPARRVAQELPESPQIAVPTPTVLHQTEPASISPETEPPVPRFAMTQDPKLVVLMISASEEVVSRMLAIAKGANAETPYQIIRDDGDIRANDYFAERLRLNATYPSN